MPRIQKILIANRGEIARRILRTCQDMGIHTVAVCSEADLDAPHVEEADEAVVLGGAPAHESYLNIPRILDAARRTGADAIHPGYGFLSENAAFAQACLDAGITFIGPRPEVIRQMGSKIEAKRLVRARGVPVVPGWEGDEADLDTLEARALEVGFPLLVKASAGGGGKGMRLVHGPAELRAALEGARREAQGAFGDGTLFLERYIEEPRHIEVQIFGDTHGKVIHLFERECSIQRRHQKIIEESPSPAVDEDLRAALVDAAVEVGLALGYTGAGTVEMILDKTGEFYFLEVNTRLQVEHPVTEMVTGIDLVRLQIEVAEGKAITLDPDLMEPMGHAIECRLYAEDPTRGFLPATGTVLDWEVPDVHWLRVDAGITTGSEVGIHYDPMLAKVVVHGEDRDEALRRMDWALAHLNLAGLTTNRDFLRLLVNHPAFAEGALHTHFIDEHFPEASQRVPALDPEDHHELLAAAALAEVIAGRVGDPILPEVPAGWRNNRVRDPSLTLQVGGEDTEVSYRDMGGSLYRVSCQGPRLGRWMGEVRVLAIEGFSEVGTWDGPLALKLYVNGRVGRHRVNRQGERRWVQGPRGGIVAALVPRFPEAAGLGSLGGAVAPMPGKVLRVLVEVGAPVKAGQPLVILEAMKMEHTLTAERDGVVGKVHAAVGAVVEAGRVLVTVDDA